MTERKNEVKPSGGFLMPMPQKCSSLRRVQSAGNPSGFAGFACGQYDVCTCLSKGLNIAQELVQFHGTAEAYLKDRVVFTGNIMAFHDLTAVSDKFQKTGYNLKPSKNNNPATHTQANGRVAAIRKGTRLIPCPESCSPASSRRR